MTNTSSVNLAMRVASIALKAASLSNSWSSFDGQSAGGKGWLTGQMSTTAQVASSIIFRLPALNMIGLVTLFGEAASTYTVVSMLTEIQGSIDRVREQMRESIARVEERITQEGRRTRFIMVRR
jgi:hypothetical protein